MNARPTDISSLTALIGSADDTVSKAQVAIDDAAAELACLIGPLAAAHRCASLALELSRLAEEEGHL